MRKFCKAGWCLMHTNKDKVGELGLCCISCDHRFKCDCKCGVLEMKKLKVEDCHDLIPELDHKKKVLEEKKEMMKTLKTECETLHYDIKALEEESIYKCDCGGTIKYDTNVVLMSLPPRYQGRCSLCSETFYTETKKVKEKFYI